MPHPPDARGPSTRDPSKGGPSEGGPSKAGNREDGGAPPAAPAGDAAPGYRRPRLTPPRWLAALSVAVGAVLFYFFLVSIWPREATEELAGPQRASLIGIALFFHLGYIVAPFWTGRGPWLSFFAGLLLAPVLVGWMLQFVPGGFRDPISAVLALLGLVAIVGHYFLIFRHFWVDFQVSRTAGRPD